MKKRQHQHERSNIEAHNKKRKSKVQLKRKVSPKQIL